MSDLILRPRTVLAPLLNLSVASQIISLAAALIAGNSETPPPSARIIVAGVVEVPEGEPLSEGRALARSYRAMYNFLPTRSGTCPRAPEGDHADATGPQIPVHRIVKVAHSVADAIREAAIEEGADLLLLHWKGQQHERKGVVFGENIDLLLEDPPCNILLFRPGNWGTMSSILVAARGGPSAELGLAAAAALASNTGASITLLHGVPAARMVDAPVVATGSRSRGRQSLLEIEPATEDRMRGDEPYIDLVARAANLAAALQLNIHPALTVSGEVADFVADNAAEHDMVVLGVSGRARGKGVELNSVVRGVIAMRDKPLLLARAPRDIDLQDYRRRVTAHTDYTGEIAGEQWFVENTYHADELSDLDSWLALKESRGAYLSVVLPTHNDGAHIFSLLTGLRKALMERAQIADEILVIDAGSSDNTAATAADMGFPVLQMGRERGSGGGAFEPGTLVHGALNLARGNIIVWLDPKVGRSYPGFVTALLPPLLTDPGIDLVKPFWSLDGSGTAGVVANGWSARFSILRPADLLKLKIDELSALPLNAWFRAFFPALSAVVDPTSRVFAARASLLREVMPALQKQQELLEGVSPYVHRMTAGLGFYTGLLLQTAGRHGARSIAQVEMPRRRQHQPSATPPYADLRQLRQVAELLHLFWLHRAESSDPDTLERIQRRVNASIT